MDGEDAKRLVREVIEHVWHQGDVGFIDHAYTPNFVARVPRSGYQGLDEFRRYVAETRRGIPDIYFYVKQQHAEGDHVVTRFQMTGTHSGDFLGIPATGKTIDVEGVSIHRMQRGRIAESWTVWDVLGLCHEIGVVPALTELMNG